MRLVHEKDDVLQLLADEVPHRDARLEDVVVVGHDRVGALRELELDLEGADLLAARLLEDGVGIVVRVAVAQTTENVRARHLLRVVLGEAAELLVAEDPVVGAHLFLRAHLERRERALVHRHEGGDGHLLLEGLGRQEDDLLAGRKPSRSAG